MFVSLSGSTLVYLKKDLKFKSNEQILVLGETYFFIYDLTQIKLSKF